MATTHRPRRRSVLLAVLSILAACRALPATAQSIQITGLPPYGGPPGGVVTGIVTGADPSTHRVAGYIHVDGSGWWSKPGGLTHVVAIQPNGSFAMPVVDGGLDNRATIFFAALIHQSHVPPEALGAPRIPTGLQSLALDTEQRFGRTVQFAGRTWGVKDAPLPVGPGQNVFSSAASDVFVDAQGRLHLSVRQHGGQWFASEVVLLDALGHGTYAFQTESRLDTLDPRLVFGAFTWDPYGDGPRAPGNPHRELDCEDSRWGTASNPTSSQFVVQPFGTPGNLLRYTLPDLASDARVTRMLTWKPGSVRFLAARGHHSLLSVPPASVFAAFEFLHAPAQNHVVPGSGRAQFHFNLWMNSVEVGGPFPPVPPAAAVEVVISGFEYFTLPSRSR